MVEALNKELSANEKKRLQSVIDELNSFIPVEPVKDEKQQEKPVAVVQSEQQKENPVEPVPIINQQNNLGAVGVQGGQQLTKFFNNAMTNNV